jgi:hypothetical protein
MSAIDREKIFEKLRNYHTDEFPEKMKNPEVDALKVKFNAVEDRVVGMILSLVNGKAEYIDSTKELTDFQATLKSMPAIASDEANKNLFASKIEKLIEIMDMARESGFTLRKVRGKVIQV